MIRSLFFCGYVLGLVALVLLFATIRDLRQAEALGVLAQLAIPIALTALAAVLMALAGYLALRHYMAGVRPRPMATRVARFQPRSAPGR